MKKSQYFPFECSVLNKGTTGIIFLTYLVWRGPWLGIESTGTSRTQRQHYTTRLSRRRYASEIILLSILFARTYLIHIYICMSMAVTNVSLWWGKVFLSNALIINQCISRIVVLDSSLIKYLLKLLTCDERTLAKTYPLLKTHVDNYTVLQKLKQLCL